jgi:hypothetical protein
MFQYDFMTFSDIGTIHLLVFLLVRSGCAYICLLSSDQQLL